MANNSNEKFNWTRKKIKVHERKRVKKEQIHKNKLAKANRRRVGETLEIKNDATETIPVIPVLQTKNVENAIIKAWNEREGKTLQGGDVIEITGGSSEVKIIEVSDDAIIYELDKEKKLFDLKEFRKFITKFNLSIHPIPTI